MPVGRFWERVKRHGERAEREERKWLLGLWLTARSVADIMLMEREPPYHKSEKPPQSSQAEIKRMRESLQETQQDIAEGLSGPAHYGHRYGLTSIFGEPPEQERKAMTADDWREMERRAEAEWMRRAQEEINAQKARRRSP